MSFFGLYSVSLAEEELSNYEDICQTAVGIVSSFGTFKVNTNRAD